MHNWLEFRLAWQIYNKGPESLIGEEKTHVGKVAQRQARIEERILSSREAVGVVVPFATLDTRLAEIRARYSSTEEYRQDLERLGMDEAALGQAVNRDLTVEAVLEKVAAGVPVVSEVDAEIYFRLHPGAFERVEARRLRHILITFNDAAEKAKGLELLEGLRRSVKTGDEFAAAALSHSQCPTAMQQGEMGLVKAGQLYAELEPAAFALPVGVVSAVQESPMGLHLLWCDEIFPGQTLGFADVRAQLLEKLMDKRRSAAQRQWLESLLKPNKAIA